MILKKFYINIQLQKENLVNNSLKNRLILGVIIVFALLIFYYLKLDQYFYFILTIFVVSELLKISRLNKTSILFIVFISLLLFALTQFFSQVLILNFYIVIIFFLLSLFVKKYLEIFFILFIFFFLIIHFNLLQLNRNLFYIIIFISFFNDTLAYIFGNLFKGPKISKKISPNKTWSGTISSFILTSILLINLDFIYIHAFFIAILFYFGDLYFSFIKRKLLLKDFSNFLGSHGGILDRLDSITLTSIFVFYLNYV